jgi:hypothetical protein
MDAFIARMQKMATNHLGITPASPSAIILRQQKTCEEVTGYLASPTFQVRLSFMTWDMDVCQDVFATLKHHDRIAEITFDKVPSSVFEKISAFMQEPLPVVKRLKIEGNIDFTHPEKNVLVFPKNLPLDFRIAHYVASYSRHYPHFSYPPLILPALTFPICRFLDVPLRR